MISSCREVGQPGPRDIRREEPNDILYEYHVATCALHIKSVSRFMVLKITFLDDAKTREVVFSNKRSVVMVDKNKCYLP